MNDDVGSSFGFRRFPMVLVWMAVIFAGTAGGLVEPGLFMANAAGSAAVSISRPAPAAQGGQAYRLAYTVHATIDQFWRFKTDFDNDFLVQNKYIDAHRVIARRDNQVITEDKYSYKPNVVFRWRTVVFPDRYRLEYELLNPEQCGQAFHHGHIQLTPAPDGTRVVQTAYFDFFGASLWAAYPWRGGMKDFLTYTAKWERQAFAQWRRRRDISPE